MPARDIIVIGASAGGVEALKLLVRELPKDLPAAVFVVLHTGAHPSILPDILTVAGSLPADHPVDGSPIEKGRIYVAPPDHHLIVVSGHVHVARGPKENNARPSINTLFRTAAAAYANRVVGVVLTGNLNDGTVGLWEIKRHGGVTVVQDPAEAAFPSMPLSAVENVEIDHTVSVNGIGFLLWQIANGLLEVPMGTHSESMNGGTAFSGLTCPECRGPLWEEEHGKVKDFKCRVGHAYSFESLIAEHANTTERALWTAVLAVEEEAILARQAAQRTTDERTRRSYETNAELREQRAAIIREMLTEPDLPFKQSEVTT